MDIETMSDQQILDFVRGRKASPKTIGAIKSSMIAAFFEKKGIPIRCPFCASTQKIKNGTNKSGITRFQCKKCKKNYSLVSNTIFDGTSYSLEEMINAVHAVITQQSSVYMESNTTNGKIHNSAAWLLVHKILSILSDMQLPYLDGVVEIDEKYIREAQKGSRSLVSYLDGSSNRKARRHNYRSEAGIFGPEFINIVCAVDHSGHYWAKCVCLGPMDLPELHELSMRMVNVAYVCTDNYDVYRQWTEQEKFKHYVEPSTYRKDRKARGYVDTDDIYHTLTAEEYARDEAINRQLYKEGRYPHIENSNHDLSYDEFLAIRHKFSLGINRVNSFHAQLENYLIQNATNVSSEYLQDYVTSFTWLMNYKSAHGIRAFSRQDAEDILALMLKHTIKAKKSPTLEDIRARSVSSYPRPSKRAINMAKRQMKSARKVILTAKRDVNDMSAYEGDDDSSQYLFNKTKFFRDIGTIRLNELSKLYGVYDRNEDKATRIKRMSELPEAQDIIFYEIMVSQYGTVSNLKDAITKLPEKKKRGRPKRKTP